MPSAVPFPNKLSTPETANLHTVNFSRLIDQDSNELAKMISACERDGFFYLNLLEKGSEKFLSDLDALDRLVKGWFKQPLESKKEQTATVSNAHGQELLGRWALPPVVQEHQKLFDDFTSSSHYILKVLLTQISDGLGLRGSERLEQWHRDDLPSKSTLYFLHYPEEANKTHSNEVGQNMHTDIGSLTLLFAPQWGLQVLDSASNEWQYVEPKRGYAIINVADTLRFMTNRRFRSALHRVVPVEGQVEDRFSVSYFLRANDCVEFQASDNSNASAKSWYFRKYDTYEKPHDVQRQEPVLTGGMGNGVV
ncbi:MAG: hypothetical protein Q9201_002035 [Fulgogasparrea decipioides]